MAESTLEMQPAPSTGKERRTFRRYLHRNGIRFQKNDHSTFNKKINQSYYSKQLTAFFWWWKRGRTAPKPVVDWALGERIYLQRHNLPTDPTEEKEEIKEKVTAALTSTDGTETSVEEEERLRMPDGMEYTRIKRYKVSNSHADRKEVSVTVGVPTDAEVEALVDEVMAATEEELADPQYFKFVYVLRSGTDEFVKIGFSCDISRRMSELQTGSAQRLRLEFFFSTPRFRELERKMHEHFMEEWAHGEWFRIAPGFDYAKLAVDLDSIESIM
jgi:hypothetical protein